MKKSNVFFILFSLFIIACSESDDNKSSSTTSSNNVVSVIVDGFFDDRGFNGLASKAMRKLKEDLNISIIEKPSQSSSYLVDIESLEDSYSRLIWGVGFKLSDVLLARALEKNSINYAIVEGVYDKNVVKKLPTNLLNMIFRSEEGAFLAGYFASKASKEGKIGFIGGVKGEVLESFLYGYQAGAKYANSNVEVISQYAGTFSDLGVGRSIASNMYRKGIDIIFQAAGLTGIGVIEVAKEMGSNHYVIGVDEDQSYLAPNNVLVSAVKKIDVLIYNLTKEYLQSGVWNGGNTLKFGIKEDGLDLILNQDLKIDYYQVVYNDTMETKKNIISGDIEVPFDKVTYDKFISNISD